MKMERILGILLCLGLMAAGAAFADPPGRVGQLGMIQGDVTVDDSPARNGRVVHEGSVIEVSEGGRATLLLGKGSVFHLGGATKFVVNRYGITRQNGEESADLNLNFGKTRALILNQGGRRQINIRSRAATMGVRGTEILIDAPRREKDPVRFVTLEGLAELRMEGAVQPIAIEPNRGFSSQGVPIAPKELAEFRTNIQAQGLAPAAPRASEPLPPPPRMNGFGGLSEGNAAGGLPPVRFDPLQDRRFPPGIVPFFCNAVAGSCP